MGVAPAGRAEAVRLVGRRRCRRGSAAGRSCRSAWTSAPAAWHCPNRPMFAGRGDASPCKRAPPALFDTDLLARRRARAARIGGADFLHAAVAGEIAERLREVNRTFRAPAVVGPRAGLWAGRSAAAGAGAARRSPPDETLAARGRARTTSSCTGWRCTGRTTRSGSWCRRAGRSGPTGCSSPRSSAARRCASCAPRWPRPRSRRWAASARGWRRWARSATSAGCCSGRASRCRWPTAGAST